MAFSYFNLRIQLPGCPLWEGGHDLRTASASANPFCPRECLNVQQRYRNQPVMNALLPSVPWCLLLFKSL